MPRFMSQITRTVIFNFEFEAEDEDEANDLLDDPLWLDEQIGQEPERDVSVEHDQAQEVA